MGGPNFRLGKVIGRDPFVDPWSIGPLNPGPRAPNLRRTIPRDLTEALAFNHWITRTHRICGERVARLREEIVRIANEEWVPA